MHVEQRHTIIVRRQDAENRCTSVVPSRTWARRSPEVALAEQRSRLRELLSRHEAPGILALLVGELGLVGTAFVPRSEGPSSVTIGRHTSCDLFVDDDQAVSLRQGILVCEWNEGALTGRLIDPASSLGWVTGRRRPASELAFEDGLVAGFPGGWLFAVETGRGLGVLDRLEAPSTDLRIAPRGRAVAGSLQIAAGDAVHSFLISARGLEQGVAIGRAARCVGAELLDREGVSRVHAVLTVDVRGNPFFVDAGSTNGTWQHGQKVRVARPGEPVRLGPRGPTAWWEPVT